MVVVGFRTPVAVKTEQGSEEKDRSRSDRRGSCAYRGSSGSMSEEAPVSEDPYLSQGIMTPVAVNENCGLGRTAPAEMALN